MTQDETTQFSRGVEVVCSVVIENAAGQILLVKNHRWNGKWGLPGGHVEPGEGIEAAGIREAKEEVGLDVTSHGILTYGEMIGSADFNRPAHFVYFDIYTTVDTNAVVLEEAELSEYVWIDPRDAAQYDLGKTYPEVIAEYLRSRERLLKK
jgi:nucleoside triphosphatase